jgi:hypothetical protein
MFATAILQLEEITSVSAYPQLQKKNIALKLHIHTAAITISFSSPQL